LAGYTGGIDPYNSVLGAFSLREVRICAMHAVNLVQFYFDNILQMEIMSIASRYNVVLTSCDCVYCL